MDNLTTRGAVARARLRAWMRAEGMSKADLARRIGVTQPMASLLVRGKRGPGLRTAFAIERASQGWFLGPIRAFEWSTSYAEMLAC